MFEAVLGSRFWISGIAEWAKYRLQTVFAMFWKKFDNFNLSDFTYVLFVFLEFSFSSYMRSGIFFLCSLIVIWRNLKKKKIVKILFTSPSLFTDHWTEIWKLKSKLREREYRLSKLYSLAELIEQSAAERQNQNNGNNVLNNKFNATFLYV